MTFHGTISGKVVDSETNKPIAEVVIRIDSENLTEKTNANGDFSIFDLREGRYFLRFIHVGYRELKREIYVSDSTDLSFVIFLDPRFYETSEVIVTTEHSHSKFREISEETDVLKGKDLQKELGLTLASTLKNETGFAMRSMGPAPARPVVRGLGSDRVQLNEDGNKSTDLSGTSPDHAVTIEPFSVERIEVIRGPRTLLHSSTTIGGVINMVRHEIIQERLTSVSGTWGGYVESASSGYLGSLITSFPLNPIMIRTEISKKSAGDLITPEGRVRNSQSDNINYSVGSSWIYDTGFMGFSLRNYELDYGIPGGFIGAHPNGVTIGIEKKAVNFKTKKEFQSSFLSSLDLHITGNYYRHKEFESNGSIGTDFRIRNVNGTLNLNHDHSQFFNRGTFGFSFDLRRFEIGGNVFTPPSKSASFSSFVYEAVSFGKFSFEGAARVNYDSITPDENKPDSRIGNIGERNFLTWSLSLSALMEVTPSLSAGANISRSSRVPTIEELFSEGPHLAAYSYEIGNPDLKDEQGFGSELFVFFKDDKITFLINGFYNYLTDYIIPRNTGNINWRLILPEYQTSGVKASIYGVETEINWKLIDWMSLKNSISYTIGRDLNSNIYLPSIPPAKGKFTIDMTSGSWSGDISADYAFSQKKVDVYEEPTSGYIVYNSSLQYSVNFLNSFGVFSLSADNLLNTSYRNHLSRIKSILPEAGRNFRLSFKYYFGS